MGKRRVVGGMSTQGGRCSRTGFFGPRNGACERPTAKVKLRSQHINNKINNNINYIIFIIIFIIIIIIFIIVVKAVSVVIIISKNLSYFSA